MKYYLYIKTSPLGLKYLGKTTKDPLLYMGSGKIWKRHLKKHNLIAKDIDTEIIFETNKLDDLIKIGIELSIKYNIVESKQWANLRIENGDGGDTSKYIDYSKKSFKDSNRSKHLNTFKNKEEEIKIRLERSSKIDYMNPERLKKIKENTDWKSWGEAIKNRNTDYSKFLSKVHNKNKKEILQFDLDGKLIDEFKSSIDASNELKIGVGGIRHCLTGRNKTAHGYVWKYKNKKNE